MEYFELYNGVRIPAVGTGTNTFGRDDEDLKSVPTGNFKPMYAALEAGYELFDTAISYGNEEGIGECLKAVAPDRSKLFILGKIPNRAPYNCDRDSIRKSVRDSMKNLNIEYFDLFLIHQPVDYKAAAEGKSMDVETTVNLYKALEELYHEGVLRAIGVANFNEDQLTILMNEVEIVPMANQFRSNPAARNRPLVEFCKENKILPIAHSPMNFTAGAFRVDEAKAADYRKIAGMIGSRYGKSWAQVLLRYNYQLGICSIPKSHIYEFQKQNLDIFDFELSQADMECLY